MSLWVAISNKDHRGLGVEKADSIEQAYYQFMQKSIYPERVILLPDTVMRKSDQNFDGPAYVD